MKYCWDYEIRLGTFKVKGSPREILFSLLLAKSVKHTFSHHRNYEENFDIEKGNLKWSTWPFWETVFQRLLLQKSLIKQAGRMKNLICWKHHMFPDKYFPKKRMQKIPKLVRLGSRCINFSVLDNESFISLF